MKKTLTTGKIFAFCLGEFSRAVLDGLLVTYALKFFNVTETSGLPLLLPMGMMGLLRGIGVVYDAITDPIVASISDRMKGKKNGRRIPFMRIAAIPYALSVLLIFFPPDGTVSTANIIWVIIMLLLYYTFSTIYNVPYMALQAEIVTDTKRRVFFYTINSMMFVIGSAIIYILPVIESSFVSNGMEAITAWRIAFAVFAGIGALCAVIPAFCIKENDYVEPKSYYQPLLKSLKATFAYKSFVVMTAGYLVMQFAFSYFNAALLFYIDILLDLKSSFSTIVLGISIVFGLATYPILNKLVKKVGKKPVLIGACAAYSLIYLGIFFSKQLTALIGTNEVTGLLSNLAGEGATTGQVVVALLIGILMAFPIACTNILPPSAFADITQYDTLLTGENKAGMFIAARQFARKIATAIASTTVSFVMYIGATDAYPTVYGVRLTALIAAIAIVSALLIYAQYDDRHIVSYIEEHSKEQ